ncbi:Probable mannitol dehydrogenase [Dionaea muscipula]
MAAATGTLDGIIDTVSAVHPLQPLLGLLKTNGKLITVGVPDKPLELYTFPLISESKWRRRRHARSLPTTEIHHRLRLRVSSFHRE